VLRRLFTLPGSPDAPSPAGQPLAPRPGAPDAETATVREIVAKLDAMPRERAKFLAGFAYVLSRAAEADLTISEVETREMEQIVAKHGHVPEAQAVIVVQIAKTRAELFGATEDFLVTREFRAVATDDERLDLLRCCFLVGAADGTITAEESGTLMAIAAELGIDPPTVRKLRGEYAETFAALQTMRQMRNDAASS
jgi:uncharacterized tellurite resistance protein B-like protein